MSQLEALGLGCTIIKNDLEIKIAGDVSNMTAELQTYLGGIEEIWGHLWIQKFVETPNKFHSFLFDLP